MEKLPVSNAEHGKLTNDEEKFLEEYGERLEKLIEDLRNRPGHEARAFLRQIFNPGSWRVLMDLGKAEVLTEKALRGQNPEGFENEFNRRAARLQNAIDDFADLISPPH